MDSILWFHLECPKWAEKFDDEVEFKRKFKTFFDKRNSEYQTLVRDEHRDSDELAYDQAYYPDQVKKFGVDLSAISRAGEEDADDE
eukprot:CAMPEP_0205803520 /NCGR_PEP_ID=MMETSP0205-20121125/6210_1 /ASSEMBLY_ACC=CAM_ASM_000278 /TAXON_ID=36767 /ORGANISM="Euplotes focardii, Strain TN1" /LENGTH=85 /DNA_ID=CAMNT_0053071753 /DNA_START=129 /DNA_END=386 /DNA_ORIENTATION=+